MIECQPNTLLSIDPGRLVLGYALWKESNLTGVGLSVCKALSPAIPGSLQVSQLAAEHASQVGEAIILSTNFSHVQNCAVEFMVHYPDHGRKDTKQAQEAKAKDLLDLQAIAGWVAGQSSFNARHYTPAMWKGQMPEDVTTIKVVKALNDFEVDVLSRAKLQYPKHLHHNLIDAIGIGLHALNRTRVG